MTVSCSILGLDLTTFEPINIDTTRSIKVVIQAEDTFQGMPSA